MRIVAIISDPKHPSVPYISTWGRSLILPHDFKMVHSKKEIGSGDILFILSCSEIIGPDIRKKFRHSLVIHASDLPKGRGWSPQIWTVLNGEDSLTVSLFEAAEPVDSGNIWKKITVPLEGHELFDEINHKFYTTEVILMQWALENCDIVSPTKQPDTGITFYPRRKPEDSQLQINKTIEEQFNLLRVSDPNRYPAFFDHLGHRYYITLSKTKLKDT